MAEVQRHLAFKPSIPRNLFASDQRKVTEPLRSSAAEDPFPLWVSQCEGTWNEPSRRISLNTRCGEPAVVSTAAVPGPPLRVTNVKGTAVPAPSPVIVAVPERVTVWSFTTAELIVPVTYMALTVNDPLPAPVPTGGANARHSKSPL